MTLNWLEVVHELEKQGNYWRDRSVKTEGMSVEYQLQLICLAQTFSVLAMAIRKGIGKA
jgi:hypothetical protein